MHIATNTRIAPGTRPLLLDTDLQIIFGITIMAIVGVFTIAPALPRIVDALQISQTQVGWLITILGMMMVWGAYISYFPILMGLKLRQAPFLIGLIMTSMTMCSALSSSQMGKLSKRFSGRYLFTSSFVLYGTALLMIPFISQRWFFLIPISIFGIAQGIFIPNIQNFLGNQSSIKNRGIVMAIYGASIRIGQALGPFAMGLLFPMVGINGVFFICAGIAFAMIGIVAGMID